MPKQVLSPSHAVTGIKGSLCKTYGTQNSLHFFLSNYLTEIWDIQEQDLSAYTNLSFETYPGNSKVVAIQRHQRCPVRELTRDYMLCPCTAIKN